MSVSNYIPINIDIATINTIGLSKNVFLPATSSIYGKTISIKDITGYAATNNIIIKTQGSDYFQDATSNFIINRNFGIASFFAKSNTWYLMNPAGGAQVDTTIFAPIIYTSSIFASTLYGDGTNISNIHFGVSTISSIISYGLSSVNGGQGISSLSSLISYGLSSVYAGPGVSSLSSIISYGLSTIAQQPNDGISSLSSIISYGLSSLWFPDGISSLSSIVSYGLSSVTASQGVSSLSSIISYGLSSVNGGQGISSLSSIISYGLSSVNGGQGISSLSSIISYGLSSVSGGQGISSLSSIISYGLSSVSGGQGISSLSSIISYGLSSVSGGRGISSLSSIISYGLSSVNAGQGVSSLSSIISYGLSSVNGGQGISSLSSIISYGLSSVNGGQGISSLSSIISYGLSSVKEYVDTITPSRSNDPGPGISSLSSIVSYGLSSVSGSFGLSSLSSIISYGLSSVNAEQGISSLSSIISYGLSSVNAGQGISSLSSIISYGLSSVSGSYGVSSLSSIVSYGLSSVNAGPGVSSLSSIISYGLSTVRNMRQGISSLSSVVSYGLSSVYSPYGTSSLSSIVSYGLSSVSGSQGISSLSSIISYGLSSVHGGQGISSLSSIISYGLSSVHGGQGISSLSSIISYGLSSVNGGQGISSLSSIVSYGLSSVHGGQGISSLSSIISYGLSSVHGGQGISSLSSIISYGLSSVHGGQGISSLSSIISYGLSSVHGGQGISSLSSIISYGLSSVHGGSGISSLSSIISYGLSSVHGGSGISSLSSIISYGLSSVHGGQGISSLSSIISYGLSSVNGGQGISSLSSIISYGLSSVHGGQGISSLSSIISYGLSSIDGGASGISSLSTIISYGLSSLWSPDGVSSLSTIVSYGLSSMIQSSLTVTTVGSMNDYSIGGIGLSTLDTPPTDTITNAFAKVDNWLFRNLVDSPPVPASNSMSLFNNTGRFTYQTFDAPFQFKSAFMPNLWLPSIFSINVDIIDMSGTCISCNITDPQYLPSSGLPLSGIYFDSQSGSYPSYPFTYSNGGTVISNMYYININRFISPLFNPYIIDIYYSNYSAQPVRKLESKWIIFRGGPPSAPYNLFLDSVNATSATANFTLSNSDNRDPTNNVDYATATVHLFFSNVGGYPRRYNVDTGYYDNYVNINTPDISGSNSGDTVNVTYTGLPPDTTLSFNVYTLNSLSVDPGTISSNSEVKRTSLPDLVGDRLSNITNDSSLWITNSYTLQGLIYSNIAYGPIQVFNWNNMSGTNIYDPGIRYLINYTNWTRPNNIQIHTQLNPGSADTNIASFSVILPDIESNVFTFDGFSNTTSDYQSSNTINTTIWVGKINDSYGSDSNSSNFYLKTEVIFVNILSNYFAASPKAEPYYYTFIHSNAGAPIISITSSNYVNGIVGEPTVNALSNYKNISNAGTYGWVSGILALSNTVAFDLNLDIGNFADYFYPALTSFGTVNLSNGSYVTATSNIYSNTIIYNNNDSTTWSSQVPSPARFKLSNFIFSPTGAVWTSNGTGIQANITFQNIAALGSYQCNMPYYFDTPSLNALNTTFSNSKAIGGARQESASNFYNTIFVPYDNTQLIFNNTTCNNYNSEMPFVGGAFRFSYGIDTYYDYFQNFLPVSGFAGYSYPSSYSEIRSEYRIRYATFKYSLSNNGTNFVKLLQFAINNLSISPYDSMPNCNFRPSIVPTLWYKIANAGPFNTGWLDGNATKKSYLSFNTNNAIDSAAGLRSNDIYTPIVNTLRYFSIIPIPSTCNYDVYVKIGLSNGGSYNTARFDYIYMNQIFGSTPNAPTNLTTVQTVNSAATITFNASWSNDPINVPIISNTVITSNIVVEGFPCRWVPSGVNYSNNSLVLNISGVRNISYNLSNANTRYNISITSLNDVGIGSVSQITYTTALPNTYSNFYDGHHSIRISPQYNTTYRYSSGVAIGTRDAAIGIINCNSAFAVNGFVTFNVYVLNTTSVEPITFNYEDTQAGSNLCNVTLYLTGQVNINSTTSKQSFSNQFYSNTSLTGLNGSGGSGLTMTFSNLADRWVGYPTITGFYYTGKVGFVGSNFITASNYGYSFTLSNNFGKSLTSSSFYFDKLNSNIAPTINSVFVDTALIDSSYYSYVSGIPTFNINCNYNFWIQASNLGTLYFASPPVKVSLSNNNYNLNFPFNATTTPFYPVANTGSTPLTTRITNAQNNTFFSWANVSLASAAPAFTFSNPLTVTASACNLNSNSATSNFPFMTSNGSTFYTDSASVVLRDVTKNSNWQSVPSYGARVESGSGLYPNFNTGVGNTALFGAVYSDTADLILSYSNELQIVNGKYTGSNQYAYLQYTDLNLYFITDTLPKYAGAYTTGSIRYTTFMWYIPNDGYQYIQVNYAINGNNFPIISTDPITVFGGGVTLQYCLIGSDSSWPATKNNQTTAWQNGNATANSVNGEAQRTTNNTPGAISFENFEVNRAVNINFGNFTGTTPFMFYIRIGIPITSNFTFNNIQLTNLIV